MSILFFLRRRRIDLWSGLGEGIFLLSSGIRFMSGYLKTASVYARVALKDNAGNGTAKNIVDQIAKGIEQSPKPE